jgi:hypothetical protein
LIRFRTGPSGRRKPMLVGTRLLIRQVIAIVRHHDGDLHGTAAYLDVPVRHVRAARSFYADYAGEVDADAAWAARLEADERRRWEREQAALA